METQHKTKSQWKLTRTQSSLRSSQTVRSSSIQSSPSSPFDDETNKKNRKITDSNRFSLTLISSSMILFYLFFYCYFSKAEIPTSENLLLALIFIAVVLYFVYKYQNHLKDMLIRFGYTHASSKRVMWFIGDDSEFMKNTERFSVREGVAFYGTGDFYEGEFNKGKCNGSGVYHYFANGSYEGDWVDGRYDGYGVESWAKGSRYRGMYRHGMRHGYGVYRFYTGDVYAGEWCNGQSHGVGVQSCCDGSSYVGEFKFGVKHGLGSYHFRNGDRYAGEYFGDRIHGFGVYHFANGHYYEGSWHEGTKQGYGMYTFRNGDRKCGEWDSGNLKTPLMPINDAVSQVVQAARKTAGKAIQVRRVDEQVNQAVMAANRAATAARVAAVKAVQNQIDGNFCYTNVLER